MAEIIYESAITSTDFASHIQGGLGICNVIIHVGYVIRNCD
ncbi:MAG: hypothetical protein QXP02_03125 [Desulfurococcaceae archaeon]